MSVLRKICSIVFLIIVVLFIFQFAFSKKYPSKTKVNDTKAQYQPEKDNGMNRLGNEKSPYLQQHKNNPVDWYPWSEEAFQKAKKEDKLIFLSIGYSTCHWCHVMEHESFEDKDIAQYMNENYVSIKVDREERPDVDNIYMQAVMIMTGSGGWPLSVFLTPDKKPFTGGTYFPPDNRWGRPGFKDILQSTNTLWKNDREKVLKAAESLTGYIQDNLSTEKAEDSLVNEMILTDAMKQYTQSYDPHYGGFGGSPKFPRSHNLSFILRNFKRTQDADALKMVEKTLAEMAKGGMYDQLGGGYHRYSTDEYWHIPHFEKMLYDQALLATAYLEAYQVTKNEQYAHIAREILDYVLRDMTDEEGGFYSAEDADSLPPEDYSNMSVDPNLSAEKSEGAFYIWEESEILDVLGEDSAKIFNYYYGVKPRGNAESDPHGEFKNKNTLFIAHSTEETAVKFNTPEDEIKKILASAEKTLFDVREKRPRPHLDDKILVDWNGLMISSFAFASRVLNEKKYLTAAENSAEFVLKHLIRADGRLLHRYRDGEAGILGTIEDYAFFVHGLIDLYQATFDVRYLSEANRLTESMIKLFWDEKGGGFFFVGNDAEELISQQKEVYDGAIPSGNSVAALNLMRLSHLTMNRDFEANVEEMTKTFAETIKKYPSGYPVFLMAIDYAYGPSKEIVLAGKRDDDAFQSMLSALYDRFIPNKIVIHRPLNQAEAREIINLVPFIEVQAAIDNQVTAYVCENYRCKLPTTDINEFIAHLEETSKKVEK